MQLRPHQTAALDMLKLSLGKGHKRPMVQAPTGFGKTVLAGAIVKGALAKGNRIIFCVPAISLINQTVQSFHREGIHDIGVIQADHEMTNPAMPVQVASIQTLHRRNIPMADVVVIDEAHRWFKFYERWFELWNAVPFIGLSATPWTKGLGKHYDDLIIAATTQELIDQGYLSDFRVYAPSHPDLSGAKTRAGDYVEEQLAEVMNENTLVADAVSIWKQKAENRPTLCFCVDRAHAKHMQERFKAAGVPAGYIDAYTEMPERDEIAKKFHAGEIKVVCNVGCLTTGVDWDVRCIVLCRPTKSEILFTQIIGRGLRTAEGKDDCIARDSLVLTDRGEVKIQHVTLDHKVWDGVEFVHHSGAICRGVQQVVEYDGLVATPDHKVMTDEGWKTIAEASGRQMRIARTGIGGEPIRFSKNCVSDDGRKQRQAQSSSEVRPLRGDAHGAVSQHSEATRHKRLPALQWAAACHRAEMAVSALSVATRSLQQSAFDILCSLWRSRHTVSLPVAQRGGSVDCRESWYSGSFAGNRPDRQQRALRAWKFALGASSGKYWKQQKINGIEREVHRVPRKSPGDSLCRCDASQAHLLRDDRQANHREVEHPVVQTQREVWDILNAGPLQRFTANGRLVHNCLILDHSDTHLRLGFVTDIHHEELDKGQERKNAKAEPKERLPKECPSCSFLKPAKIHECPACGFKPEKTSAIEAGEGELAELKRKNKTNREMTPEQKKKFYGELKGYAISKGFKIGWAAHAYKEKFGVFPNFYKDAKALEPTSDVLGYVRHLNIKRAKSKRVA